MKLNPQFSLFLSLFLVVLSTPLCDSQPPESSPTLARELNAILQDYAFRAFVRHPKTGITYDGSVPSNLTGIQIAALRLRSGSLRKRGVTRYKEFEIPAGVIIQPYVERIVLVYHNLGNWSSFYYPLTGFTYLAPVLGLFAYDASNLSATDLPELDFVASGSPLLIKFTNLSPVSGAVMAQCVWFDLDGVPVFRDLVSSNTCSTYRRGHFSIVVNSTEIPSPPGPGVFPSEHKKNSRVWKIVGGVIGGFVVLVLVVLLMAWISRWKRGRKVAKMERRAEVGEALQMTRVGDTQAPVALGTRTQPRLEDEYVA